MNRSITLRSKIFLGFAAIAFLVVANTLISYMGAQRLRAANLEIQKVGMTAADVTEFDHAVQELRLRVNRFVASGYESLRDDILLLNEQLTERVGEVTQAQTDPENAYNFTQINTHLAQYARQFSLVVDEREIRAQLVHERLPARSALIGEQLGKLNVLMSEGAENHQAHLAVLRCESLFSRAEKLLLRYYESPDSTLVNQAVVLLKSARASIEDIDLPIDSQVLTHTLSADLQDFEELAVRAVQATRSYLYLVNVVMAGEASEIAYYSELLRASSVARQAALSRELDVITEFINRVVLAGIALTLIIALIIAVRLAYLVVQPVTALTETFEHLASGGSVVTIPGTERRDEIGQMARAARVFSDQNRDTRELLTQSEELGRKLQQKAEELEATNADLDSFAYVASHDLKSPLRGIRQLAEWIEEDSADVLVGESVRHLDEMKKRVWKMESLLDDLLNYSRVGRMEPVPEKVNIGVVLNGIRDLIDNPSGVMLRWPKDMPEFCTIRIAIEQVLLNLVGNAVNHNHRGSDGLVDISWSVEHEFYKFVIEDNGPGISPKHHERIFQLYQRVGDPSIDGSGMGLAIVKKRIEQMGGSIGVKSALDAGATFYFTWPINVPTQGQEQ